MSLKSYRRFLTDLEVQLQSAIADLENLGFHHHAEGSPEFVHYLRCTTWLIEVNDRLVWYYDHKTASSSRAD